MAQKQKVLGEIEQDRKKLSKTLQELLEKRRGHLEKKRGEGAKDSFDAAVVKSIRSQASSVGIRYR